MENLRINFSINYDKKEIFVICENDSYFNRTWKFKSSKDLESGISEALIYIESVSNKLKPIK